MKKSFFIIVSLLALGCTQNKVSYQIHNQSSSNIFVEFVILENNDTLLLELGYADHVNHYLFSDEALEGLDVDWMSDRPVSINLITNQLGDTIQFNPNLEENWSLNAFENKGSYYRQYHLVITEDSF